MENFLNIGCHLSSSDGYENMGKNALEIGANTFAFFTRNPRGFSSRPLDIDDVNALKSLCELNNFAPLVAHAPYTLNPCSAKEEVRELAKTLMMEDIKRMELLPNNYYNFHPGSHLGQGVDVGINETSELLNDVLFENMSTTVLIETMAGKGTEIGTTFEEVAQIINKVQLKNKIGVCIDTCHLWEGYYDVVNQLDETLESFDKIIGLKYLKAVHLNDSKNPFGFHHDRHEKIGEGQIGLDALVRVINNEHLKRLPFILETPNELDGYKKEIELLRSLYNK